MKIKLVFDDWQKNDKSIYCTSKGIELSENEFHSGTTFNGEIELTIEQEKEFERALRDKFQPVFWIMKE